MDLGIPPNKSRIRLSQTLRNSGFSAREPAALALLPGLPAAGQAQGLVPQADPEQRRAAQLALQRPPRGGASRRGGAPLAPRPKTYMT